jgi:pyruvate/2-oxoglutarate dehydrogenase complex dihydrolipoamide dehydrogenase (E3) component
MKNYDNLIIGFGKAGKTLAVLLTSKNESTALIERNSLMYGGTCINVGCIPSKSLETSARLSSSIGGTPEQRSSFYRAAVEKKSMLTAVLRQKNYEKVKNSGADIVDGTASFIDSHTLRVIYPDNTSEDFTGKRIFINTGSSPFIPPIPGLQESKHVYVSETLMDLDSLPDRLAIIGGGYIGLEFASYYANFGSKVTILQDQEAFIPREDEEISKSVLKQMEERGITILRSVKTDSVEDHDTFSSIQYEQKGEKKRLDAEAILIATGRRANTRDLHLECAGIEVNQRGEIAVDSHLRTSLSHIYAMGDVKGGLQFTYISLDDFRIVKDDLFGNGHRTADNRGSIPYCVFLDPPLSRIGMSEKEAIDKGYDIMIGRLSANAIPKAKILDRTDGMLKVIIDKKTDLILGAHLFCAESHELINLIKTAMDSEIPYTALRDQIYTHPTMAEAFNDLFANVH